MKKLLAILLVLCFCATPAMAKTVDFYGSIRFMTGYYDIDSEFPGGPAVDNVLRADDSGFLFGLSPGSRAGVRVAASDTMSGHLEYGFGAGNATLRLLYGVWDFGAGKLKIGQDHSTATFLGYSGQLADTGQGGYGNLLGQGLPYHRTPQIQLIMDDFTFAVVERAKNTLTDGTPAVAATEDDPAIPAIGTKDHTPRFEASYVFRTPLVNIRPIAGFQSYSHDTLGTVNSYLAGLGASFDFSPAYLKVTGSYYRNPGAYGYNGLTGFGGLQNPTADDDSDLYQGTLVAGMAISPTMTFEAGVAYGYVERGDADQDAWLAYAQLPIVMDRGLIVTPEIGYYKVGDLEPAGVDFGDMTYVSVNFMVNF